jgi:hypothetical protein
MAPRSFTYRPLQGKNWIDRDPSIEALLSHARNKHLGYQKLHEISGVAAGTFKNWDLGKTRTPHNITLCAAATALGIVRADRLDRDGNLIVDYREARVIDVEIEREKQARWILRHGTAKQKQQIKRRRKVNGHG